MFLVDGVLFKLKSTNRTQVVLPNHAFESALTFLGYHVMMPSIIKFNVPATPVSKLILLCCSLKSNALKSRCQLALSDTMGTRDFETTFPWFKLAPTINVASLSIPSQWTFNGIYNTPGGIKNPNAVNHFDPNAWEGELKVWDVECPDVGETSAYFSVELNLQAVGGDAVYGLKSYQLLETIPGKLADGVDTYTVYNGWHMLIDC